MKWDDAKAPGLEEIERIAREAFDGLPAEFRAQCNDLLIRVVDFPDQQVIAEMGLESPFDIMGLYHGVAAPFKSVSDPHPHMDVVYLYRRPLLDYWAEFDETLGDLVRHVLIHEIGHHMGFSDDDMHALEDAAG